MSDTEALLGDLRAEGEELDGLVAGLSDEAWRTPTPADGWSIAHQIAHLAWTDARAVQAAEDPGGFADEVRKAFAAPERFVDEGAERGATEPPAVLLRRWREGRERLAWVLAAQPTGARLPWYGPPMSVLSMVTARLMETWAHGQDVADALGVRRTPTARLRHVARIGVRARGYAYAARGLEPPTEEFRVELTGPGGEVWTYGPEGAPQRVTGPALDFCLLATQRAHRDDLALRAEGPDADHWLNIAQAFAGPPGQGRRPGKGVAGVSTGAAPDEPTAPGTDASPAGGTRRARTAPAGERAPTGGGAPGGDAPSGGGAPGGDAPSGGGAPGGDAPSGGAVPGGATPTGGAAPGGDAPMGSAAPGGATPTGGAAPGGDAPSGGTVPGDGAAPAGGAA